MLEVTIAERWKRYKYNGQPTNYDISTSGRVRFHDSKIIKPRSGLTQKGYEKISLRIPNIGTIPFQVHRLVAETFIPNPENKPQVNHIDGCKTNNHVYNLEWVTNEENHTHAMNNDLLHSVLSKKDVREICEVLSSGNYTYDKLAKKYNCVPETIRAILVGKTWRRITSGYVFKLKRRLDEDDANMACALLEKGYSPEDIGKILNCSKEVIKRIKYRKNWKEITKKYNC